MFELGIFCVIFLAVSYGAVLWLPISAPANTSLTLSALGSC